MNLKVKQTNKANMIVLSRQSYGYKLDLNVSLCRLLLAPYIGGQVPESWSDMIQTHSVGKFTI
jgi:hypothetical protein